MTQTVPTRLLRPLALGQPVTAWRDDVVVQNNMSQTFAVDGNVPTTEGRMIRTDRYKYCVYVHGQYRESLVDLEKDPGEQTNVIASFRDDGGADRRAWHSGCNEFDCPWELLPSL